jgi:hypothetical protein
MFAPNPPHTFPRLDCSFPSSDSPLGTFPSSLLSTSLRLRQCWVDVRTSPCFWGLALSPTCTVLHPCLLSLHLSVLSELPAAADVCLCPKCLPERDRPTQKCRQSGGLNSPTFHLPPPLCFVFSRPSHYHISSHSLHRLRKIKHPRPLFQQLRGQLELRTLLSGSRIVRGWGAINVLQFHRILAV